MENSVNGSTLNYVQVMTSRLMMFDEGSVQSIEGLSLKGVMAGLTQQLTG